MSAPTVECPECLGGGCRAIGRAPLGAPPDDVEINECSVCSGTGEVPAQCEGTFSGAPGAGPVRCDAEATETVDGEPFCTPCAAEARRWAIRNDEDPAQPGRRAS